MDTPVLVPFDKTKTGLLFRTDVKALVAKLEALAAASSSASRLHEISKSIQDHPSRDLRDTLTHKLSSASEVQALVYLKEEYVAHGKVWGYRHSFLVPESSMLAENSIQPLPLLRAVGGAGREMFDLLTDAVALAASVVSESGEPHPPRVCIYEPDADGLWRLTSWKERPI